MFSLVYVLLPFSDRPPAEAIRASLARYERGGRGNVPDAWLAFHDETEHVRSLHEDAFVFERDDGGAMRIEGGDVDHLDVGIVRAEMEQRGVRRWAVRFAAIEPDLAQFAERYVRDLERHPVTGGYGRWLNPLGRWDWWDLGGRFDGRIVGEGRRAGRTASIVSSGPNPGRSVLSGIEVALVQAFGSGEPVPVIVEADSNIELVSRLLDDARAGREHACPGAVLLPPGSLTDEGRWLRSWPEIDPAATVRWLGFDEASQWQDAVIGAYERFSDHWAAGVAYHL